MLTAPKEPAWKIPLALHQELAHKTKSLRIRSSFAGFQLAAERRMNMRRLSGEYAGNLFF
jgi:hypothetical protein